MLYFRTLGIFKAIRLSCTDRQNKKPPESLLGASYFLEITKEINILF